MGFKAFIDTNIIVDFVQPERPFHQSATDLFVALGEGLFEAFTSESVITTTLYLLRSGYTREQKNKLIFNLNEKLTQLACTNHLIKTASLKDPSDFEDALLYEIAAANGMDYFITSNTKDFKKIQLPGIPVITASQFVKLISQGL